MSPRNEEQNAQIKDERHEQILSAALKVFAAKGFAATKIGDIASRAEVSHGLVYHYFKSKEEIFHALLKRALSTSSSSVTQVERLDIPPIEKVRVIAQYILKNIESFEDTAYYFLIVLHAAVMEASQEIAELSEDTAEAVRAMERILVEGQKRGEVIEGEAHDMATAFFSAIQGLAVNKLAVKGFRMPDAELLVNMVRKH
jgi:AcrR family transcriptional regulator